MSLLLKSHWTAVPFAFGARSVAVHYASCFLAIALTFAPTYSAFMDYDPSGFAVTPNTLLLPGLP